MLRATARRSICEYNFGHPPISGTFRTHGYTPGNTPPPLPDTGVKRAVLPNGARLITHDKGGIQSTVGIYVEAGAKYDPASAPGLSYAMRWALLTSNMENSLFQIDRTFRSFGASYSHSEVRKRHIGIRLDARRDMWVEPFGQLTTSIAAPRFAESDIERFRDTWDAILEEQRWQNPREYVVDQLERVAFYKEPLGNPRVVLAKTNDEATHEKLLQQYCTQFVPQNVTIAGVNVTAEELTQAYLQAPYPHSAEAPHFKATARSSLAHTREANQFHAGRQEHEFEKRAKAMGTKPYMEEEVIVALGWATNGRDDSVAEYATSAVCNELMAIALKDGINYNRFETHSGARSFYRPYSSTGLIGVTVRSGPSSIVADLKETVNALPKAAAADSLDAAKTRALSSLYNSELELGREYCDFLGTSRFSETELIEAIKAVTADAATKELQRIRSVAPSLFATGDVMSFPTLRQMGFR